MMKLLNKYLFIVLFSLVSLTQLLSCDNSLAIVDRNSDESEAFVEEDNDSQVDEVISDPFIPSKEWQPIRKGQIIPSALHYRINLETGVKEAKLMDETKDVDKTVKLIDRPKKVSQMKTKKDLKADSMAKQIKDILKNMKFNEKFEETTDSSNDFRSINEIRKEFNEMNIKIRSESEVLEVLLKQYNNSLNVQKLSLLSEIEYLVHSIDTAQDFIKFNGIELLLPDLNSTDSKLRAQIAFTMGSAMNSNPKVQIRVLKSGALKELLLLLGTDSSFDVKKKCLFAISSLVRQFPIAQKSLIKEYGGLSIFGQLFLKSDFESIKLSSKVITLLNDLFIERQFASNYSKSDATTQIKLKQYNQIDLNEAIVSQGFCQLIPNMLNSVDNDIIEKTIEAMDTFSDICGHEFKNSSTLLRQIRDNYEVLSKSEANENSNDFYFTNLYKLSVNLMKKIDSISKNEL